MFKNILNKSLLMILLSSIMLFSCEGLPLPIEKPEEKSEKPIERKIVSETQNNIVYTRITNSKGELLEFIFNNAKNEALLMFNGEESILRQEVTASGIRYSNAQYVFTQWKDEIELKHYVKTIFKY